MTLSDRKFKTIMINILMVIKEKRKQHAKTERSIKMEILVNLHYKDISNICSLKIKKWVTNYGILCTEIVFE